MKKTQQAFQSSFDDKIAKHGWAIQGVFGSATSPTFSYTVGLSENKLPEIVVFGLPPQVAASFLNVLARRFTTEGVPPLDTNLDEVAEGLPVRLLPVPNAEADKYLFQAKHRYADYTALQLVWPDPRGRFPWDANFDPELTWDQPVLRDQLH